MLESIFRAVRKGDGGRGNKDLLPEAQMAACQHSRSSPGVQEKGTFEDSENWMQNVNFLIG